MKYYTFDLGGTSIKGIKFDDNKNVIEKYHLEYKERMPNGLNVDLTHALSLIDEVLQQEQEKFLLGLSIPGVINPKSTKILSNSAFVNVDVDITKFFSKNKNLTKIKIQNDGKAALLGEVFQRNIKDKDIVLLTIGTAVGGAAYINNKILNNSHFFAGEYTRMFTNISDKDNFEQVAMYCGTMQACYRYAKRNNLNVKDVNGLLLIEKLEEGDEEVIELFDNWTTSLAKLIVNVNLILDVNEIILGGGISNYEPFVQQLNLKVNRMSEKIKLPMPKVNSSEVKNDAGCYGMLSILLGDE